MTCKSTPSNECCQPDQYWHYGLEHCVEMEDQVNAPVDVMDSFTMELGCPAATHFNKGLCCADNDFNKAGTCTTSSSSEGVENCKVYGWTAATATTCLECQTGTDFAQTVTSNNTTL